MKTQTTFASPRAPLLARIALLALAFAAGQASAQTLSGTMYERSVPVYSISSTSLLFGELVTFSGTAIVRSRLATDPTGGQPVMVYQLDLSGVSARGLLSFKSYKVVSDETVMQPPLSGTSFDYLFPFDSNGTFGLSLAQTRMGTANVSLNVNTATGAVTSATIGLQAR